MSELLTGTNWQKRKTIKQANIDLWDSMAQSFMDKMLPNFEEDSFLQLLQTNNMIHDDLSILDVGCGAGTYSVVLAKYCKNVVGVDLSPKMIELANKRAIESRLENVEFHCMDWHELDLEKEDFIKKFDLVIAHNTPAIQCEDTFIKLSEASKKWCVLSKPTHRKDPLSDEIKKLAGIEERTEISDKMIANAFHILWDLGVLPCFHYEKQNWNLKKTKEEAYGLYINRVKTYREITELEEKQLRDYIDSMEKDGFIEESVNTTITTLYWDMEEKDNESEIMG
ncbi:class I SAM-dependent methyltransferase [Alkalibacter mobilis]|uniref:class I SAM-dependent methyltransferase n=1 Tax=Alkalibacter mobilis TaxID=2787712 RepID=UPI00189D8F06|nr:class I SAM-dependent methyltransferase [Alkalibacter mobilis]MBF7097868.1 methyltransferase domain-containing protein [Alkalibacter mobilis]